MDTKARANKILPIMKKIESRQGWNRLLFLISLGVAFHSLTCIGNEKKLKNYDYAGIVGLGITAKRACSLSKKEEQGQKLWHILQQKSAQRA